MNDHLSRVGRTFIQLAAGGVFTALFEQVAKDVPSGATPYVLIGSTLLVTVTQNVAEEMGWIPMLLKPKGE